MIDSQIVEMTICLCSTTQRYSCRMERGGGDYGRLLVCCLFSCLLACLLVCLYVHEAALNEAIHVFLLSFSMLHLQCVLLRTFYDGWMGGWMDDDDDVLAVVYHDGGWARSLEIADRGLLLQSGNANAIKTTHTPPPKLYFPTFLLFRQG